MSKLLTFLGLAIASLTVPLNANNIVTNPGFETGNLVGWTANIDWNFWQVPHTGTYSAGTGDCIQICGNIYQDLATVNGQSYSFSFWYLKNPNNGFKVLWGGSAVVNIANETRSPIWTQIILNETATSTSTRIEFILGGHPKTGQ